MRIVLARVLTALGTLAFVLTFNFFLFRAAGDPTSNLLRKPQISREEIERLIQERGLDESQLEQFRIYIGNILTGEFETSYSSNRPVLDELMDALPNTLLLVGVASVVAAAVGIWMGIAAGSRRGSATDAALTRGSLTFYSMPEFWLGMILIWLFAVTVPLFPTGLKYEPGATYDSKLEEIADVAQHAILPILTLAIGLAAQYVVITRAALADVLNQDFITTARAIGLPRRRLLRQHAVPNALLPVVTLASLNLGFVVSGAITVEAVFSWPGIGDLTLRAIDTKDYPLLQGIFLLTSALVIIVNLLTDFLYVYLDPRVRAA